MISPNSADSDRTTNPERDAARLEIRALTSADMHWHLEGLGILLQDAVHAGAGLGYLAPLSRDAAERDWQALQPELGPMRQLWIALEGRQVVGCAQLRLAPTANARHRCELERAMVLVSHRRRGIASTLLAALEREAVDQGRTLVVADLLADSEAMSWLSRQGWRSAGTVPGYATSADGRLRDGVRVFKPLLSRRT